MNKYRGEVSIKLGEREYVLRPTFEALVEIEERLGSGLVLIARRFANREFGIRDVACIIAAGIKGAGGKVPENIGELIAKAGILPYAETIVLFLTGALSGEDNEGKAGASSGDQK